MGPGEIASIINVAVELAIDDFDYTFVYGHQSKLSCDFVTVKLYDLYLIELIDNFGVF